MTKLQPGICFVHLRLCAVLYQVTNLSCKVQEMWLPRIIEPRTSTIDFVRPYNNYVLYNCTQCILHRASNWITEHTHTYTDVPSHTAHKSWLRVMSKDSMYPAQTLTSLGTHLVQDPIAACPAPDRVCGLDSIHLSTRCSRSTQHAPKSRLDARFEAGKAGQGHTSTDVIDRLLQSEICLALLCCCRVHFLVLAIHCFDTPQQKIL